MLLFLINIPRNYFSCIDLSTVTIYVCVWCVVCCDKLMLIRW